DGMLKLTTHYHYLPSGRNIQKRPGEKAWGVDPTDGYYVPLTPAQAEALKTNRDQRGVLGLAKDEQPAVPTRATPKALAERYADPQLAGALRTMVARLTGGEFIKVGQPAGLQEEHAQRLEELRRRREQLAQQLQSLDREIADAPLTKGAKKE